MIDITGKSGGAWAARTPDHLIKSHIHNRYNSTTYASGFYAPRRGIRQFINNLARSFMQGFLLVALVSGCSYNAYNDPHIEWPQAWQVDNHAEKAKQRQGFNYKEQDRYWCGVYG